VGVVAPKAEDRLPPGSADERPAPSRFPCFDGLRALAALSVFSFHVAAEMSRQNPNFLPDGVQSWLNSAGGFGVAAFFVISGFLLYRPYALAMVEGRPAPRLIPFWRRRFLRIFPAYWIVLAVTVYVLGQYTFASVGDALTFFGLVQNYRSLYVFWAVPVAWTLVIEVSFYVFLPIYSGVVRLATRRITQPRSRLQVQLVALAVIAGFGLVARYWAYYGHFVVPAAGTWFAMYLSSSWLPAFLDWFAFGMLMALASSWLSIGGGVPKVVALLGRQPWISWLIAVECYWLVVQLHFGLFASARPSAPAQSFLASTFSGVAAAFFVLPAVFGVQSRRGIRRALQTPVLVMLGVVSYGIYLWHLPILGEAVNRLPSGLPMLVQVSLILGATVVVAVVSWEVVERPIIRWSSRNAPASLFTGHIGRANRDEPMSDPEVAPRQGGWKTARLAVAALVILLAALALTIGSLDLRRPSDIAQDDHFAWKESRAAVWDNFERSRDSGLGVTMTRQPWTELFGSWSVDEGTAEVRDRGFAVVRVRASHIRATGAGIAFRCADRRNCWWVEPVPRWNSWDVRKIVNGVVTDIGTVGAAPTASDDSVAVHLQGNVITIAVDGFRYRSIVDPALRDAVGVGLARFYGEGSKRWESFEAQR
jgi:peptidoglycan/LPS O-acetylase OafA/YrhL